MYSLKNKKLKIGKSKKLKIGKSYGPFKKVKTKKKKLCTV